VIMPAGDAIRRMLSNRCLYHMIGSKPEIVYDALYAWCPSLTSEHHGWYPEALQKEMRT
jgi:hypothetical protein